MRNSHREALQPRFLTIYAICKSASFPIVKVMDTSFAQVRQKERIAYEMIRGSSNSISTIPIITNSLSNCGSLW